MATKVVSESDRFSLEIWLVRVCHNQPLETYQVRWTVENRTWHKSFGSKHDLMIFLDTVRTSFTMLMGRYLGDIELPSKPDLVVPVLIR